MISISRFMLLAASLLAFPVAGAMAQQQTGGGNGGSSMSGSSMKSTNTPESKQANPSATHGNAMKSASPGYEHKSDVSNGSKAAGNAAAGQSTKPQ
jgi:hypothetical protein